MRTSTSRSVGAIALLASHVAALGCGSSGASPAVAPPATVAVVPEPAAVAAPCASAEPGALVMSFSLEGTHGMDFSETLSVGCDGEVVLDAPRPWTVELRERPGRYTHRIDAARVAQLRDLAVRLARPVPTPSLPPQGADLTVSAYTTPPTSRPLRPGEGAADGEAAAAMSSITSELVATLPPLVVCDLVVELAPSVYPLTAAAEGTVLVTLHNPAEHPIHVSLPRLREAIEIVTPAGNAATISPATIAMFMRSDMGVVGELLDEESRERTTLELAAGVRTFAALPATFPAAGPVRARARITARVSCGPPTEVERSLPMHTYESPEVMLDVAASEAR